MTIDPGTRKTFFEPSNPSIWTPLCTTHDDLAWDVVIQDDPSLATAGRDPGSLRDLEPAHRAGTREARNGVGGGMRFCRTWNRTPISYKQNNIYIHIISIVIYDL